MRKEEMLRYAAEAGADKAASVSVRDIPFDPSFRELCRQNACGQYGKSWMCPPHIGDIRELIARAQTYQNAVLYQIVRPLEDSFDFEGMMAAAHEINRISLHLRRMLSAAASEALVLAAGACLLCERCTLPDGEPCRFPQLAAPSLEAYGVDVSRLCAACGLPYVNGANTVTYFGAVLFNGEDEDA